jgi:E1A/CREB-binding protein
VEAIYPVSDPVALQDRRVTSLILYAMTVEKAMFETATSREEYYQLVAEKILRIRKELEQRRMMKLQMEGESLQMLSVIRAHISDEAVAV